MRFFFLLKHVFPIEVSSPLNVVPMSSDIETPVSGKLKYPQSETFPSDGSLHKVSSFRRRVRHLRRTLEQAAISSMIRRTAV